MPASGMRDLPGGGVSVFQCSWVADNPAVPCCPDTTAPHACHACQM